MNMMDKNKNKFMNNKERDFIKTRAIDNWLKDVTNI
jgi:hypothetical protein